MSGNVASEIRLGTGTLTIDGEDDGTFKGFITGSGNLVKEGSGKLTFSDNQIESTHTGSIIINGGTLAVDDWGSLPENASITLADVADAVLEVYGYGQISSLNGGGANGGNLKLNDGVVIESGNYSGSITSVYEHGLGGVITKIGSGSLTLSGNNGSFGVAMYEGTMAITGDNNGLGNITVDGGLLTISGNNSLGGDIYVNGGTLIHSGTSTNVVAPFRKTTIRDGTFIASGSILLGDIAIESNATFRCEGSSNTSCTSVTLVYPGGLLDINGCDMSIGSLIGYGANVCNVHLGSGTLTIGANNTTYAGVISGEGGNLIVDGGPYNLKAQILTGANTYTGTTTILSGTLKLSGGDNRLPTGTAVVMENNYYAILDLTNTSQTIASLSGGGSDMGCGGKIYLDYASTLTVGDETNTTFAGSITGPSGGYAGGTLIKQGSGTLTLTGENYVSQTFINEGAIKLLNTGFAAVTLADVAGVALDVEGTVGVGTLTGGGSNGGNVTISSGTLTVGTGDFVGTIAGNGNLKTEVLLSSYTLKLSGANTYGGSTTINRNTLQLSGGDNRLPVTTAVIFGDNGGTLDLNGHNQTIASLSSSFNSNSVVNLGSGTLTVGDQNNTTFFGTVNASGGNLIKQGDGTLQIQYLNGNFDSLTVNRGSLELNPFMATIGAVNLADVPNAILAMSGSIGSLNGGGPNGGTIRIYTLTVDSGNFAGIINSSASDASITKQGAGTLILSGANTYTGSTTVSEGTLQLEGGDNRLPTATQVTIDSPGILDLNDQNQTIWRLSGSLGSRINLGSGTLSVGTGSFSGAIEGENGNLCKYFNTTLNLFDANTYTGNTTVLGGILDVTGSLANNGSDKIFVAADGTDFAAALLRNVGIDASYDGFGSTAIGDDAFGSAADLIDGINTGTEKSLLMQWRLGNEDDLAAGLASDVLNLSGMVNDGDQTDQFTLQMSYSVDALPGGADAEATLAEDGKIQLVWFNETESLWSNAALGNIGEENDVLFMGVGFSADGVLGHWGIDTTAHTVWAVLDHNSQFAVAVPEPGTLTLLAIGLFGVLAFARKYRPSR